MSQQCPPAGYVPVSRRDTPLSRRRHCGPGRPGVKGERLPFLAKLAAAAEFAQVTVVRYGRTKTVAAAEPSPACGIPCSWTATPASPPPRRRQ
jgi:hypothetical protein